jgi:electron transfer flavoprotein beta subunit
VKIRVNAQQTGIDTNVKHSMVRRVLPFFLHFAETASSKNPFDEIGAVTPSHTASFHNFFFLFLAVEEAVRLRERLKDKVKSITVVTLGPAKAAETVRTALAMGADAGVHIELPESAPVPEPLGVARALRAVIERRRGQGQGGTDTDLVIMGKQAIDDDLGQTGQMLAALWGAAQATCASGIEVDVERRVVRVRTEVDGGAQELLCTLPAVVTTDLRCVDVNAGFLSLFAFLKVFFFF